MRKKFGQTRTKLDHGWLKVEEHRAWYHKSFGRFTFQVHPTDEGKWQVVEFDGPIRFGPFDSPVDAMAWLEKGYGGAV